MKSIISTLILSITIFTMKGQTTSQSEAPIKKWSLNKFYVGMTSIGDMIEQKTLDTENYLEIDKAKHPELQTRSQRRTSAEGPGLKVKASFSPYNYTKGKRQTTHNLDFGVTYVPFKEVMITYDNSLTTPWGDTNYHYMTYCEYYNEVNLLAAYNIRSNPSKLFGVYGGTEVSFGSTFGNTMMIWGTDLDRERTPVSRTIQSSRIALNGGFSIHPINRISMDFGFQYGLSKIIMKGKPYNGQFASLNFGLSVFLGESFSQRKEKFDAFKKKILKK